MKPELIRININVGYSVNIELSEKELRALDALVGYGFDSFMEVFKTKLGSSYIGPFEQDMKALFDRIEGIRHNIKTIDEMKKLLLDQGNKVK
jgi:hypothetical protein